MNKHIRSILDRYEYPIINSFTFANGDMLVLRSHFIGEVYKIRVLCKSTINISKIMNIEEIKIILLKSDLSEFINALDSFNVNEHDNFGNSILHYYP
jgi:hypothetical protein